MNCEEKKRESERERERRKERKEDTIGHGQVIGYQVKRSSKTCNITYGRRSDYVRRTLPLETILGRNINKIVR